MNKLIEPIEDGDIYKITQNKDTLVIVINKHYPDRSHDYTYIYQKGPCYIDIVGKSYKGVARIPVDETETYSKLGNINTNKLFRILYGNN
jgi:hypothetical protein